MLRHGFSPDFCTLHSTTQVKHKATVEVVMLRQLYPHNESLYSSNITERFFNPPSTNTIVEDFSESADSTANMHILPSSSSPGRKPWLTEVIIPYFSGETEMVLEMANEAYRKYATLLWTFRHTWKAVSLYL